MVFLVFIVFSKTTQKQFSKTGSKVPTFICSWPAGRSRSVFLIKLSQKTLGAEKKEFNI